MADWNKISTGANLAGNALSGIGGYFSSIGAAKGAESNAETARINAGKSDLNYQAAINEMLTNKALTLESNRTQWTYGGLTMAGTPSGVNKATAATYAADVNMLKQNMEFDRSIYESTARSYEDAAKSSRLGAGLSLVQAGVSAASFAALLT